MADKHYPTELYESPTTLDVQTDECYCCANPQNWNLVLIKFLAIQDEKKCYHLDAKYDWIAVYFCDECMNNCKTDLAIGVTIANALSDICIDINDTKSNNMMTASF